MSVTGERSLTAHCNKELKMLMTLYGPNVESPVTFIINRLLI